ncbi:uncharacterized protein SOCE26_105820 [Sorangium cellulosum]|uniref:Uncharacterized protein n=1 Tax=Sorangium cellulosum TaxID=56 RepID=A0A2L0FC04_SORCE|nr:uncharacterized protein SOCE26_105820 [Sorangium cellulosum]
MKPDPDGVSWSVAVELLGFEEDDRARPKQVGWTQAFVGGAQFIASPLAEPIVHRAAPHRQHRLTSAEPRDHVSLRALRATPRASRPIGSPNSNIDAPAHAGSSRGSPTSSGPCASSASATEP